MRSRKSGFSLIEVLVAAVVLGLSLTAMVGMFFFSQNLTALTDDSTTSYNVARQQVESVKALGFKFAPEGTSTVFVDRAGLNPTSTQGANSYFRVVTVIASDRFAYNASTGTYSVADLALRTVTVTVTRTSDNREMSMLATYLARSGV